MSKQKEMKTLDRNKRCEACNRSPFIIFHAPAFRNRWTWLCPRCWISEAKHKILGGGNGQVFYNKPESMPL